MRFPPCFLVSGALGRGLTADLPHIFERFYKTADSSGSGLGLAIARNLVLAHGGDIEAESAPGAGTTMRITIPLDEPAGPTAGDWNAKGPRSPEAPGAEDF